MLPQPLRVPLAILALAVSSSVGAASLPVTLDRVQGEVSAPQVLDAGSVLRTGAQGRVRLGFNGVPTLALGSDGELALHSADRHILRAKLQAGALHVDTVGNGVRDLRLNAGALRLRITAAEAWIETGPGTAQVCLIRGMVDAQLDGQPQRLDVPGQCLRNSGITTLWTVVPAQVLQQRVAQTQPDANGVAAVVVPAPAPVAPKSEPVPVPVPAPAPTPAKVPVPVPVAEPAPLPAPPVAVQAAVPELEHAPAEPAKAAIPSALLDPAPLPEVPPEAVEEPAPPANARPDPIPLPPLERTPEADVAPLMETAAVAPAEVPADSAQDLPLSAEPEVDDGRRWSVVLASMGSRDAADQQAAMYRELGLDAVAREYRVGDRHGFRVGIGRFETREAAEEHLATLLEQHADLVGWLAKY